jgi:D-alanyl-D-alanine dipeptidase
MASILINALCYPGARCFCLTVRQKLVLSIGFIFLFFLFSFSGQAQECLLDEQLRKLGLLDLQQEIPDIQVDLRYSGTGNFLGQDVYGCLQKAYAHPLMAEKLRKVAGILQKKHPSFRLLVFDAARPLRCQQALWNALPLPESKKHIYVANPKRGSIHNYGLAIDLTLTDSKGKPLDMGTEFDSFGALSQPRCEEKMLRSGKLKRNQVQNRLFLRRAMLQAGFSITSSEWWHFNACPLRKAKAMCKIIP